MRVYNAKLIRYVTNDIYYVLLFFVLIEMGNTAHAGSTISVFTRKTKVSDFVNLIENVFKWTLSVAGAIALFMLIISGYMYMTSTGDEQKTTKAKKTMYWTLGGLILLLLAYSIGLIIYNIFF